MFSKIHVEEPADPPDWPRMRSHAIARRKYRRRMVAVCVIGIVLWGGLMADLARADTGEDTPQIIYLPCESAPSFSANGVGPRGAPSDTYLAMVQERNARELIAYIDNLAPGYVSGGTHRTRACRTARRHPGFAFAAVRSGPSHRNPHPVGARCSRYLPEEEEMTRVFHKIRDAIDRAIRALAEGIEHWK
jgi:hypothetical protein